MRDMQVFTILKLKTKEKIRLNFALYTNYVKIDNRFEK